MKILTWESLAEALSVAWRVELRYDPDAPVSSEIHNVLDVPLRVDVARGVGALEELAEYPYTSGTGKEEAPEHLMTLGQVEDQSGSN